MNLRFSGARFLPPAAAVSKRKLLRATFGAGTHALAAPPPPAARLAVGTLRRHAATVAVRPPRAASHTPSRGDRFHVYRPQHFQILHVLSFDPVMMVSPS